MNVNSLQKFDFAYTPSNPNLDPSAKILNGSLTVQGNVIAFFYGELQVYDTLTCFGEVQVLNGEPLVQYLRGSYDDISLYGTLEVLDDTTLNGVMEVL